MPGWGQPRLESPNSTASTERTTTSPILTPVCCAIERYPLSGGGDAIIWTGPKGPERSKLVIRVSRDHDQPLHLLKSL